ncbi:Protein-tyrosine phosphatase-like [Phytophthora cactorum]|nr:Protein-tyrosine phosphatase-like [Phytophthora cactorum]
MAPKTDSLFCWIEEREREHLEHFNSSWGRVLDAGTGRHSLSWLLRGGASSFIKGVVAVTGEKPLANELSAEFDPIKTPHANHYLVGAIEGFAPYYQDQICGRLEKMLAPGGRIYLVGLQPLSESQAPMGSSDADVEASKLVQEVARTRDACLLLAGRRCYREYPIDWSHRQLEKVGLEVANSVRLTNVYGHSAITRQLEVGRRHVPLFKDSVLADNMQQALDRVDERLEREFGSGTLPKEEQRRIRFGFDYTFDLRAAMSTYEKTLIPPLNFSMVASGVYRSGFPNRKNHAFLQQLGLKSVLYLCHQGHQPENVAFFKENSIEVFQCPIDGNKEPFISINPDAMADALRHLLGTLDYGKRFVSLCATKRCCYSLSRCKKSPDLGALYERNGCVIGCMRKMENWSLTSIIDEYCRFAGPRMRLLDQQFIEFFTPTIQYDERQKPKWLSSSV